MQKSAIYNFSDDEFKKIVSESFSITEVTRKCGYKTCKSGGGRQKVTQRIKNLEINTDHFRATGRQYEKPPYNKILDYTKLLTKKSDSNRITVRDIVLRERLLNYECASCGNTGVWNDSPLSLQLHHKDGDPTNNEIGNLEFLCPNCHSQTDNYGFKNTKYPEKKRYYCIVCGKEITRDSRTGRCKDCASKSRIIKMPAKEELVKIIKEIKFKKYICYHFGICDHTLDSWLVTYGLPTHISELHKYIRDNSL